MLDETRARHRPGGHSLLPGVGGFCAPVFDAQGRLAMGLVVLGSVATLDTAWDTPPLALLACAQQLSRDLGTPPPPERPRCAAHRRPRLRRQKGVAGPDRGRPGRALAGAGRTGQPVARPGKGHSAMDTLTDPSAVASTPPGTESPAAQAAPEPVNTSTVRWIALPPPPPPPPPKPKPVVRKPPPPSLSSAIEALGEPIAPLPVEDMIEDILESTDPQTRSKRRHQTTPPPPHPKPQPKPSPPDSAVATAPPAPTSHGPGSARRQPAGQCLAVVRRQRPRPRASTIPPAA
ncbi:MAG: hypothetical protein R3E42_18500 [Burkholderiaceae bacterium]